MSDIDKPSPNAPNITLTIRMIMGKEVGSIIGKGGEIINNIREESGAKIHITDGSIPERIVTVSGSTDAILKAFTKICNKFEEDNQTSNGRPSSSTGSNGNTVTLRLIVPASQCGSLIGKGGSKIKEIREVSGANVQIASEMLPSSTERAVTISASSTEAITQCIYHICLVMLDSPPKGTPVPYVPKGNAIGLLAATNGSGSSRSGGNHHRGNLGGGGGGLGALSSQLHDNPLAGLLSLGGGASTLAALATLAGSQIRDGGGRRGDGGGNTQTFEMSIPNDLIGCIIGKGGSKIAEIRQISGAMIRISKSEENGASADESLDRQITISGHPDSVALAKSLINMSVEIQKTKIEERERDRNGSGDASGAGGGGREHRGGSSRYGGMASNSSNMADLGLAQLLAKPEALTTALTTLASLNSLGGLGSGLLSSLAAASGGGGGGNSMSGVGQVTGVHRSRYGNSRGNRDDGRESKRSKFAPY